MGRLYAYQDKLPQIAASALLLDSAEVTGDVVIGGDTIIGADDHHPLGQANHRLELSIVFGLAMA